MRREEIMELVCLAGFKLLVLTCDMWFWLELDFGDSHISNGLFEMSVELCNGQCLMFG